MCNLKVRVSIFTVLLAFFSNRLVTSAAKKGKVELGTLVLMFYVTFYMEIGIISLMGS